MKLLILFLLIASQASSQGKSNARVDTTEGFVEYFTIDGRQFDRCIKITITAEKYNYGGHRFNDKEKLISIQLLTGYEMDTSKYYLFVPWKDIQKKKGNGGIVFAGEMKQ